MHARRFATQARIKQLAPKTEVREYIEILPPTPVDLLRQYPAVANALFSAQRLPVPMPLNPIAIAVVRGKITCRGARLSSMGSMEGHSMHDRMRAFSHH